MLSFWYQNRLQDSFVRKIPTIAILQVVPMVHGAQNLHCPSSFDSLQTPVPTWHPTRNGEVHIVCRHQLCKTGPATRDSLSKSIFQEFFIKDVHLRHHVKDLVGGIRVIPIMQVSQQVMHSDAPEHQQLFPASRVCQNSQSLSG